MCGERSGVKPGDVVMVLAHNGIYYPVALYGILIAGMSFSFRGVECKIIFSCISP